MWFVLKMQVIFSEIDGIRYIWVNSANLMIFGQKKTHQIGVFYPKIAELVLFSPKSNKIMTLSKFRQFGDFLPKKLQNCFFSPSYLAKQK